MSLRRAVVLGVVVLMALLGQWWYRAGHLSEAEAKGLFEWLSCDECSDGELAFIRDTMGARARGPLREALLALPPGYVESARRALVTSAEGRPARTVDSAYVDHYLSNFEATVQRRAAVGLAALGDTASLREALDSAAVRGYRSDVRDVVEGALAGLAAPGYQTRVVESIFVSPTSLTLAVGDSAFLGATTRDDSGNPVGGTIAWSSTDPGVATVSSSVRGRARVVGQSAGSAQIAATAGSVSDGAVVTVTAPAGPGPRLEIVGGDGQVDTAGTVLNDSLIVRVTDAAGDELSGALVIWRVTRGTGAGTGTRTPTGANGEASFRPALGNAPEIMWVDAEAVGRRVRFRIRTHLP